MNNSGKISAGVAYAHDKADLFQSLKKQNKFVISVKRGKGFEKAPIKDFTLLFFKNLHLLIKNKVDLLEALNICLFLFKSPEKKAIIQQIISSIENGFSLSKSLSLFDQFFDRIVVKSIEIAESTATMASTIENLISYLQKKERTREEIKNALTYPTILFCIMFSIFLFWIIYIVPNFVDLFQDVGIEIPLATRIVVAFRTFVIYYSWFVLIPLIFVFKMKLLKINQILNKIPFLSNHMRDVKVLNFFLSMKIMLQNKINLLSVLNALEEKELDISQVIDKIQKGNNLFVSLGCLNILKEYELAVIRSGEKSGTLQQSFEILSDILQHKVKSRTDKIISLVQPVMILVVGILLIAVICAVFVPLYSNLNLDF